MDYYSLDDVLKAYKISETALRLKIHQGEIHTKKFSFNKDEKQFVVFLISKKELKKLEKYKISEPIFNKKSQPEYYEKKKKEQREEVKRYKQTKEKFRKSYKAYEEYLKSPEWKQKAKQRAELDGFQCYICHSAINIEVHHWTYKNLYHENMNDLITLCEKCHNKLHEHDIFLKKITGGYIK